VVNTPRLPDNTLVPSTSRLTRYLAIAIRERRAALGEKATQEEIAHKARLTVRHLQKLEQGATNPKLDTLLAVAKALRTNLQSLLDRADELAAGKHR
jgi:transcriptional regulator with XRE-family HTH domain